MRDFQSPGRSQVVACNGMAATSHGLATLTAVNMLAAGGNAMDAAVAACAVQCVVEPGSTGIGGDCFALFSPAGSDRLIAYNGSGRAPAAATPEWYRENGFTEIPRHSPHAVTIPGAVDAWTRLIADHGRKSMEEVLRPAIALARDGYAITPRVAFDWAAQKDLLAKDPNTAAIFLPDGRTPHAGEKHRQTRLADTLEAIGAAGRDAFYQGAVAAELVDCLRAKGGLHTLDDFKSARGNYFTPVKTTFRGYDIHECGPNGQGIIALLILNILRGFRAEGEPMSVERLHREIEATRLAYSVRDAVLADPDQAPVPTDWLLSDALADRLRAVIDPKRAVETLPCFAPPEHRDTVYITVVDKDRNAVSFINSLFNPFGSAIAAPASGVLLHNRGQGFVVKPGHPNTIAPGKRPLHTIIPGMVTKNGRVHMSFGVMGGHYQAMGHAYFLSRVLDYGMDMQSAMELPRLFPKPGSGEVDAEHTLPSATRSALAERGFRLTEPAAPIGGAQSIMIDWENGTLTGASDPRKDGCALGY
ncbi:gamma-glutamyltransferase [Telmatospirillum siberiense]|uniref:Glutathione hydrolase proenzyme n=1 Tax=Telmatospirillum siberiense TaxID=382514 RepID=A0A2N3PTV6_9PROT|nr:gamma-glutamyltransferase [Telmatospirillum siberiense]PKU23817.1 gamma-glutamyltransferase [Telmatospirillum siberiense]